LLLAAPTKSGFFLGGGGHGGTTGMRHSACLGVSQPSVSLSFQLSIDHFFSDLWSLVSGLWSLEIKEYLSNANV
jgi:hypothetical protein